MVQTESNIFIFDTLQQLEAKNVCILELWEHISVQ